MATVTTMAATKAALYDALGSALTAPVLYAFPEDNRSQFVVLGRVDDSDVEEVALKAGRRKKDERYTIEIIIYTTSSTAQQAESDACDLLGDIEDVVAVDHTLGVDGVFAIQPVGRSMRTEAAEYGYLTTLTLTIEIRARIS